MNSLRIQIVCPAKPGTRFGNRVTALRWQAILKQLGCRVRLVNNYEHRPTDVLLALHARRSASSIAQFREHQPRQPIILALTGTDLYQDLRGSQTAQDSLRRATRIVVLQDQALNELTPTQRRNVRVIYQSDHPVRARRPTQPRTLRVIVAGHLREVKDPFRAALAVRNLPTASRIVVDHFGAAMHTRMAKRAQDEMRRNKRYRWHGEITRGALRQRLARCWLLVLSSKLEGGANVLSEALANGTPVLSSNIAGSVGLLGSDYRGYFDVGATKELRTQLRTCEEDDSYYEVLRKQVCQRTYLVDPARELAAWRLLLAEL